MKKKGVLARQKTTRRHPHKEGDVVSLEDKKLKTDRDMNCQSEDVIKPAKELRDSGGSGESRNSGPGQEYPTIEYDGEQYRVDEISYAYHYKRLLADDEELEHICGDPLCIEPRHLRAVKRKLKG